MCLTFSWASYPGGSLVEPKYIIFSSLFSFIVINSVTFSPYWFVSGNLPVWWWSDANEVLFEMLAYASKIFAKSEFNKEVFRCCSSRFHIRDEVSVLITKTRGGEKEPSSPPLPLILSCFFSSSAYFRVGGWRREKKKKTGRWSQEEGRGFVASSIDSYVGKCS